MSEHQLGSSIPIRFLSVEDVLQLQQDTIEREGGGRGVRDLGLLNAAIMMPRQTFGGVYLHPDLAAMAAAYLFHIANNHPFVDGNKRAAAMSALVFLDGNGVRDLPDPVELEEKTLVVASGELSKEHLTQWFRRTVG